MSYSMVIEKQGEGVLCRFFISAWGVLLFLCSVSGYTWNATGHRLVAQIAYDQLTPKAKRWCRDVFSSTDVSAEYDFINSSTWLDTLRQYRIHQYDAWHYIDIPFTRDKSALPVVNSKNALWAIKRAQQVLSSDASTKASKAFYLKVLIHVVGDIHQPLHTATKISRHAPRGDLGGNLYTFSKSSIGKNMHQYWDRGAGSLKKESWAMRKIHAIKIELKWPLHRTTQHNIIENWLNESHQLAITEAYSIRTHKKPDNKYRDKVLYFSERQLALAGYRLAYLLNEIASSV